jgi:homoserine kinase type II
VIYTGNQVTGLIDFGAVDIDTPATDIARLLRSLVHNDQTEWRSGLAAYSAMRQLSDNESLAVFAIDAANPILAGCNWINWVYVEQREFEQRQQVIEQFRTILTRVAIAEQ